MTDEPMTSSDAAIRREAEQPETGEAEHPEAGAQGMPEMSVEDALLFSISMFADLSWIHLGIRTHPASGEAKTDFVQARLSIDAVKALVTLARGPPGCPPDARPAEPALQPAVELCAALSERVKRESKGEE